MKTIQINNNQYVLKYTLRSFFTFENMTGYAFRFGKMIDEYILFYSVLLANNESFDMPFDGFISLCDESPSLFQEFTVWALKEIELQMQAAAKLKEKDLKKKRKK
ncbi:hypothetical protein [Bacteroides sp.]|uniref:hypothetical protein n=1 Tax=Bacteroides sp. TaxID=29523 RepID=UPI002FC737AA